MRQLLTTGVLWFSAIGCGLMAGVYFAFSAFVMRSLASIAPASGIAAMNAINVKILGSLFMPLFLGTTLTAAILAGLAIFAWSDPRAIAMLAGDTLYVIGMFAVTMVFNVPLNDALAVIDPASAQGAASWQRYIRDWTLWNHVRTLASAVASALFIAAIAGGGEVPA
jgi:uncharacterized membrane protein